MPPGLEYRRIASACLALSDRASCRSWSPSGDSHEKRAKALIALEHGCVPITVAMTPEQLDQIADTVRNNLLNHLDSEVDRAMGQLGITGEISDDEWQSLVDQILG